MLSRPFLVLYLAVFVATIGISMVSPLLPVYAKELGATGIWIGLTFSVFAVTLTLISPFAGRWSDRFGRKPFIVVGLLLYFVAALGYLTAESFGQVIAFRALSGLGTSLIFAVARAYVADLVPRGQEGRWFGVFVTADIVGFGVGPLIAGVVREFVSFDAVFVTMAALMASSAMIVGTLLPGHARGARRLEGGATEASWPMRRALRDRLVLALTCVMGFAAMSFGATFSFLALRLEDLGLSVAMVGVAFGVNSLATGVAQPGLGWAVDRVDRRFAAAAGLVGTGGLIVLLGVARDQGVLLFLLGAVGVGNALAMVAASAMQVEAGRRAGMGVVQGLNSAGEGAGILIGSLGGGLVVELFDVDAAFFFSGATIALGAVAFLALTRGEDIAALASPALRRAVRATLEEGTPALVVGGGATTPDGGRGAPGWAGAPGEAPLPVAPRRRAPR